MIYHEMSAKSGEGVQDMFSDMINQIIINKRRQQESE